jgi:hypothetical protein
MAQECNQKVCFLSTHHHPSCLVHWWVLVHSGPKAERLKSMIANWESKGRELFCSGIQSTFIHGIDHYSCVFVHCMVCCLTTHWVEKKTLLSLPLSLSLSLSFELHHNLWEQSQVGNANWFRKRWKSKIWKDLKRVEIWRIEVCFLKMGNERLYVCLSKYAFGEHHSASTKWIHKQKREIF